MAQPSSSLGSRQEYFSSLVELMREGDSTALQALFDEVGGVLYGVALRLLRSREDAEEVVCDALVRAWNQAKNYDPQRGSVVSWLIIMARSIALDRLRSASHAHLAKWVDLNEALSAASVLDIDAAIADQQGRRLQQALEGLPEEQKKVILLAYFKGLSHSEIAERLHEPLGTIKTRMRLGLQRLRVSLEGLV